MGSNHIDHVRIAQVIRFSVARLQQAYFIQRVKCHVNFVGGSRDLGYYRVRIALLLMPSNVVRLSHEQA